MNRTVDLERLDALLKAVSDEALQALADHGHFASLHEGYAVLAEEVDELWDIVRQKRNLRDPEKTRKEAVQVAAVAVKIAMAFGPVALTPAE